MTAGTHSLRTLSAAKLRSGVIVAIIAVVGLAGMGWYRWQTGTPTTQPIASNGAVPAPTKTVTALGRLEPQGTAIQVSAPASSNGNRVEQLLVDEGDRVRTGQVVAILDNRDSLQAALTAAEDQVRLAQAQLRQVQAGAKVGEIQAQAARAQQAKAELDTDRAAQADEISRLQAQWDGDRQAQEATIDRLQAALHNAQSEFERYRRLQAEGGLSQADLDSKRLTLDTAQAQVVEAQAVLHRINLTAQRQLDQAKTKLQRTIASGQQQVRAATATLSQVQEVRPVDVQVAQAEVDRAIAAAQQAKASLDLASVKAPQDGTVMKISTYAGEVVSATDGILTLGQTDHMEAVLEVYQSDIARIRPGQKVRLTSDSLPDQMLLGTVERVGWQVLRQQVVNTDPSANIDNRVVEVRVALTPASSRHATRLANLQVLAAIAL